ncbi:ATP-binding protein [Nocardiopsis sp. FR6]|uniref:ATP-binding protein n=1 Tax=Nocardiopsis sp. FR6 TaxID=2605986 RepID=UPI001F296DBD|nr:ATP-binding protein [Nocardiopsis sp. FR6]
MLGRAPHQCLNHALKLPGRPEQAAVLRRSLAAVLPGYATDPGLALASELFNNAVAHTRSGEEGGEVIVAVNRLPGRVRVKVVDQGPRAPEGTSPHLHPLEPGREGGLGLRLVAAEASRWGTHHDGGRTTVWFEVERSATRV